MLMKNKILVLFAHPVLEKSRVNKYLIEGLEDIDGLTFHDLYENYPALDIDVAKEQELLLNHNVVVFHHPFYWYSTPAIIKEWQDLVLTHGWAYGSQGVALKGKYMMNVVTTGGSASAYEEGGHNNFTMREFLAPMEQTANLCKMIFLPPFTVHGTLSISSKELEEHKKKLFELYHQIIMGKIDLMKSTPLPRINSFTG
jgi:glutathione-regulated potassium-efflux system ancillary protein KefG